MSKLGQQLIDRGALSAADIDRVRDVSGKTGGRFAATIVRLGLVDEETVAASIAELAGLPFMRRNQFPDVLPPSVTLNPRYLAKRSAAPVAWDDGRLVVAMADPDDDETIAGITFATGASITPVVATYSDIGEFLARTMGSDDALASFAADLSSGAEDDIERMLEDESEAPIIRTVQRLLADAVNRRASDVHIEPMARHLMVRFRVDGRLLEVERLPDGLARPIASRIKVMASLDIAETRLPQDGRLRLNVRGREVDVRVSTSPTAWGESVVLRLLGRSEVPLELDQLGLPAPLLDKLVRALDRPHGIILLTGPTGSGKTTTLYAAVNRLRKPDVKILTVEDPVEVLLDGINQVQVRPEIELSYAATLRAFLRQDPDILMIGEIRDHETAEIAMRAALTGHLVLSTLHTNSAIGAFTRLADIGVEPYLTASTVIATIAQRLIRALCPHCRRTRPITELERSQFRMAGSEAPEDVHEARGCSHCLESGYLGRIPLIEIVEVDDALRERIRSGTINDLDEQRPTPETLFGHGLAMIAAGKTDFTEVHRAIQLQ